MLVAITFGVIGVLSGRQWMGTTAELRAASVFPEPRPVARFELHTATGERFSEADLKGQWSLLFFGFTNCPDICPDTLSQLARAIDRLKLMRRERLPRVIFVSVDPQRDQGEALDEYVTWFDPDFTAVTGSDQALQQFTRQMGVIYVREPPDPESGSYSVDHSGMVVIIDPDGRLYGRFAQPIDSDELVADLFLLTSR